MEEVDLFNNLQNIVITNVGKDVWQQIGKVNLNAHNPNPGAPEHLAMVNNLLGDNAVTRNPFMRHQTLRTYRNRSGEAYGIMCSHCLIR